MKWHYARKEHSPFGNVIFIKDEFGFYDLPKVAEILGKFLGSCLQNNDNAFNMQFSQ